MAALFNFFWNHLWTDFRIGWKFEWIKVQLTQFTPCKNPVRFPFSTGTDHTTFVDLDLSFQFRYFFLVGVAYRWFIGQILSMRMWFLFEATEFQFLKQCISEYIIYSIWVHCSIPYHFIFSSLHFFSLLFSLFIQVPCFRNSILLFSFSILLIVP